MCVCVRGRAIGVVTVHGVDVLLEEVGVEPALHVRHGDIHVDLLLWRQRLLNIQLQAAQDERAKNLEDTGTMCV